MMSSPSRPFFFRSGLFFHQFVELCITSYPSPLDEGAPAPARLLLLAIAGGFEFFPACWAVDILSIIFSLLTLVLPGSSHFGDVSSKLREVFIAIFLLLSFAFRARSFARSASRHERGFNICSLTASFFWHNPALLYYASLRLWSLLRGQPVQIRAPRVFWLLIAPNYEFGEMHLEVTGDTKRRASHNSSGGIMKGLSSSLGSSFWAVLSSMGLYLISQIVAHGPSVMIHVTLWAQSHAYWSSIAPTTLVRGMENSNNGRILTQCHWVTSVRSTMGGVVDKANDATSLALTGLVSKFFRVATKPVARLSMVAGGLFGNELAERKFLTSEIQLITILPDTADGPVNCVKQWHDAHLEMPPFTAISYCWGPDDTRTNEIFVNGAKVLVTRSAFEVLVNMRSSWRPKTIWLDAICIDQDDKAETARQIPLMPHIYTYASEVVVWLGQSKTAALATSLVNRLFLINRMQATSRNTYSYEIPTNAASALEDMLRRSWFTRVWVVQEVVLPKGRITVRYGNSSLSWERLSWFTQAIQRDARLMNMLAIRSGFAGFANLAAIRHIDLMRRFSCITPDLPSLPSSTAFENTIRGGPRSLSLCFYLAQMFRSGCRFECKSPHDLIYGIMGLARVQKQHLTPNYNLPLRQLYIDVVRNAIEINANSSAKPMNDFCLDFLVHAGSSYRPQTPELPSWAPEWSLRTSTHPMLGTDGVAELLNTPKALGPVLHDAASVASFAQFDAEYTPVTRHQKALDVLKRVSSETNKTLYNVTPGTEPVAHLLPDDILEVQGYQSDRIKAIGCEFPVLNVSDWRKGLRVLQKWIEFFEEHYQGAPPGLEGVGIVSSFFGLVMQGVTDVRVDYLFTSPPRTMNLRQCGDTLPRIFSILRQGLFCNVDTQPTIVNPGPSDAEAIVTALPSSLQRTCAGRCIGITERGYYGLFLPGSKPDDSVMLFAGARFPFNLRLIVDSEPGGKIFELMGPAYVQGIMDGAVVSKELVFEPVRIR
ncbi:heterokaryon incompatibility protein-domain-containing protein [Xylariales sp. PMI_506]|nr:heterokaryon incompatibility protein-domain-containing protein [Xylariales sp. PMI_506]